MRMRHIDICDMLGSTIFFPHYLINGKIFGKSLLDIKVCCDILYNFCL